MSGVSIRASAAAPCSLAYVLVLFQTSTNLVPALVDVELGDRLRASEIMDELIRPGLRRTYLSKTTK